MLAVIMAIENEDDRLFVETVFNRYAKKLYLVAYNILGNRADAEDCVQDTFVKIIDKLDRFKNAQKDDSLIKLLVIVSCAETPRLICMTKISALPRRSARRPYAMAAGRR